MEKHRNTLLASLNAITEDANPSQLTGTFVVHDFLCSWNKQIIPKEVCEENMQSLVGQYICCKYIPKEENGGEDALGDHEVSVEINRDTGMEMMSTNTIPIGHITEVWIEDEKLWCRATLWLNKFYNTLSFLNEMIENGINIPCSVEYAYSNFEVQEGIQTVKTPIYYEALCILNPIDRGDAKAVLPAYDCSRFNGFSFNEAIIEDVNKKEEKESMNDRNGGADTMENVFVKALNDISLGEQRDKLMVALSRILSAEEYNNAWIGLYNVYTDYVIYETYCDNAWKTFRIDYTVQGDEIVVNAESKKEVTLTYGYENVETTQEETSIEGATVSINKKDEEDEEETTDENTDETSDKEEEEEDEDKKSSKNSTDEPVDEPVATVVDNTKELETIASLNTQIATLQAQVAELLPYKEEIEKKAQEEAFNSVYSEYEQKFVGVNAKEEFETDEVQALVKEVLNAENSLNAKLQLADKLLELSNKLLTTTKETKPFGVELCSKEPKRLVPQKSTSSNVFCGIDLS